MTAPAADATWRQGIARLDAQIAQLRERTAELATEVILMADRTESTRRSLQDRLDVLDSFLGQVIDRVQDHTGDPDAHHEDD